MEYNKFLMKVYITFCATLLGVIAIGLAYAVNSEASVNNMVELTIYNPYRSKVSAEVKCDFNNRIKNFEYYTKVFVPGKGSTKLTVPSRFKKCEVWPKIEEWF